MLKTNKTLTWFNLYVRYDQAQLIETMNTVVVITAGQRRYEEVGVGVLLLEDYE